MKMANGGFDPAYNVQFVSDGDARVVVGVEVTNDGTDGGSLEPMHKNVCSSFDTIPKKVLVDSAYATKEGVKAVESITHSILLPSRTNVIFGGTGPKTCMISGADTLPLTSAAMLTRVYSEAPRSSMRLAEKP